MPPTMKDLGIDQLSLDERVILAHEILESINRETIRAPLTDAQRTELERRLADSIARPDAVVPWEIVKAQALARAKR